MNCDHVLGYTKGTITHRETGEIIVTWLSEMRVSHDKAILDGARFNFCPECGADVRPLHKKPIESVVFGTPTENRSPST